MPRLDLSAQKAVILPPSRTFLYTGSSAFFVYGWAASPLLPVYPTNPSTWLLEYILRRDHSAEAPSPPIAVALLDFRYMPPASASSSAASRRATSRRTADNLTADQRDGSEEPNQPHVMRSRNAQGICNCFSQTNTDANSHSSSGAASC